MTTNEEIIRYLRGVLAGLEYHKPADDDCSSTANQYYGAKSILIKMIQQLSQ